MAPPRRHLFWCDVLAEAFPGMTVEAPNGIRADLRRWILGDVGLMHARSSQARLNRVVNAQGHNLLLHVMRKGKLTLSHESGVVTAGMGDILVTDDSQPYAIDISDANDCLIFHMPASRLGDGYHGADWHGRILEGSCPNVAFFDRMLRGLWSDNTQFADVDDAMGEVLTQAALVVCRTGLVREGSVDPHCSPVEFALRNLENPELGTTVISEATGLCPRAVQKAFLRDTGLTPTAFINERRLQRSVELMAEVEAATITQVAYQVGFNDSAFFSRCFRRRFGMTPREWRARNGRLN